MLFLAALFSRASGPRRSIPAVGTALSIGATVLLGVGLPAGQAGASSTASTSAPASAAIAGRPSPGGLDLVVVGGVDAVHISTAPLGGDLLRATAAAGAGPAATRSGSRIVVSNTAGQPTTRPGALDIVVARQVQWSITLNGGAREASVDMQGGSLSALTFADGVAMMTVLDAIRRSAAAGGAWTATDAADGTGPDVI